MFKGASASVKTEQLTSQAPCSYITRSIFLPHSFCLYFFLTSTLCLYIFYIILSPSCPRASSFLFWLKKKLGHAFYRTSLFAFIPTLSLKIAWLFFFFCPAKYLLAWKKINWMGHTLVSPLYLFSWFSPFYLPSQVKRKRFPPLSKLKAVCSHCFCMFN